MAFLGGVGTLVGPTRWSPVVSTAPAIPDGAVGDRWS